MLPRRLLALCLALASGAGAAGCEPPPPKTGLGYTADAERAYQAAMEEFKAKNWIEAQAAFREVKKKYGYTRWARLAELRIADADFEQEKYAEALRGYKAFIHDHKSDTQEVAYARSRAAETQYREISDSLFLASSEERDQAATLDAYRELTSFMRDYPEARESPRVCALLEDVTARLVRHEIYVAKFYLHRDNFDAAVLRLQYALRNYVSDVQCSRTPRPDPPGSDLPPVDVPDADPANAFGLAPEALLLLGETYLKMGRREDAKTSFYVILDRYPTTSQAVAAKKYLDDLPKPNALSGARKG
jgi:outer membrane protein assembly factor BamD